MSKNLKIPEDERHKFSQPLGRLISGSRQETIPQIEGIIKQYVEEYNNIRIYLVGDIVSKDFLENNYLKTFVRVCIIDEKTQRNKIELGFDTFFDETIEFENPQGTLSEDSFNILEKIIISNRKTLLKITKGEEDLLVLPLVVLLPLNQGIKNLVFYGQPPVTDSSPPIPEGIVMVEVDKRIQKSVHKFLSIMEQG